MSRTDKLVSDIDDVLDHLAGTVDQLVTRVHPKALAKSGGDSVMSRFVDDTGAVRMETVLPVVGAVAGLVALRLVMRKILR